ncbi:hypothetical protein AaE_014443 [Aphanomyces astaci]|uniref:PX domain-containing protein n=1 Tax=Aphanomyces astaci TaxID=112090 RepID=A0A6A4Z034_APHAT|nr:hypothetical protein AaE_014443 [Aphanomyces astaci]
MIEISIVASHLAPLRKGDKEVVPWFEILGNSSATPSVGVCIECYQDFHQLHYDLSARFPDAFKQLPLPTPSHFHLPVSKAVRLNHRAIRFQYELNVYLHRVLEIHSGIENCISSKPSSTKHMTTRLAPLAFSTYSPPSSTSTWDDTAALSSDSSAQPVQSTSRVLRPPAFSFPNLNANHQPIPPAPSSLVILYGQPMHWSGYGGLLFGLFKPHPWSRACGIMSQDKAAAALIAESASNWASRLPKQFNDSCHLRCAETAKYLCVTRHHQLGPTSHRPRAALFRVVSPYNNQGSDVLHATDDVCFQAGYATCG